MLEDGCGRQLAGTTREVQQQMPDANAWPAL